MTHTESIITDHRANHEKKTVALSSVLAAIFLTLIKIIIGIMTGSLGILSEAAHSGLDLIAAVITYFAVRISGKPPDQVHTYGHGKIENLSALFETLLLLVTCAWIIYEAIQRLFFKSVEIEVTFWAFLVMGTSIIVDISRSQALMKAAKKYNSQALEADALHFSTDIWSSTVVIFGLIFVLLAEWLNIEWLAKADAVAALGVAVIVVYVSVQLGRRTILDLMDGIPPGLRDDVTEAAFVKGVLQINQIRIRQSGAETFVDMNITVSEDNSLSTAHNIATHAETAVQDILPGADVTVHMEPSPPIE